MYLATYVLAYAVSEMFWVLWILTLYRIVSSKATQILFKFDVFKVKIQVKVVWVQTRQVQLSFLRYTNYLLRSSTDQSWWIQSKGIIVRLLWDYCVITSLLQTRTIFAKFKNVNLNQALFILSHFLWILLLFRINRSNCYTDPFQIYDKGVTKAAPLEPRMKIVELLKI